MIILYIREKGHLLEIPGLKPFRTPARVDISKGDIRTIVGHLKVCDITDYEIVASKAGSTEVYRPKDFNTIQPTVVKKVKQKKPDKKLEKRINQLEKMVLELSKKPVDDSLKKEEQTANEMERFRKDVLDAIKDIRIKNVPEKSVMEELEEEAVEPFIPEIDTDGMTLKNKGEHKIIKKDKGSEDASDALSKLLK